MKLSLDVTNWKSDKEEEYALTVEMSYNHRVWYILPIISLFKHIFMYTMAVWVIPHKLSSLTAPDIMIGKLQAAIGVIHLIRNTRLDLMTVNFDYWNPNLL
jgi:hypothetical protein